MISGKRATLKFFKAGFFALIMMAAVSPDLEAESSPGYCGNPGFLPLLEKLTLELSNCSTQSNPEMTCLKSICSDVMYKFPEALVRIPDERALPVLLSALSNSRDPFVIKKALYGLRLHEQLPQPGLVRSFLTNRDSETRAYAVMLAGFHPGLISPAFLSNRWRKETNGPIRPLYEWAVKRESPLKPVYPRRISHSVLCANYFKSGAGTKDYSPANQFYYIPDTAYPEAEFLVPPILDYDKELVFDVPRQSFGVGTENIHLGDDCGWFRDGTPVFAAAAGIVRLIYSSLDWGNLIVLEHHMGTNRFCTLYGHCANLTFVTPGEIVRPGQLIAMTGMSYSYENGGYGSHCHFSIAAGGWQKPVYRIGHHVRIGLPEGQRDAEIIGFDKGKVIVKTEKGLYMIDQAPDDLNSRVQWLKGYQTKEDGTRGWLDPYDTIMHWDRGKFLEKIREE